MIDIKRELQNFSHIDLKSLSENTDNIPDNIKNSVILYNKALDNILNNKSEDIAIIELKKAISLNPDFHEAMNLLGVCYSYIQDYAKAEEIFQRVAKTENNSIEALRLLNSIDSGNHNSRAREGKKKNKTDARAKSTVNEKGVRLNDKSSVSIEKKETGTLISQQKNNAYKKSDVKKYLLCLAAGALLVFLISIPFYSHKSNVAVSNTIDNDKEIESRLEAELNTIKQQLKDSNDKYGKLEINKKESDKQVDYYKNAVKLFDIETLSAQKKYEMAADKLILLKDAGFRDLEKRKFDEICNNVLPKAAWTVYNEGLSLVSQGKYQDALGKLTKVYLYKSDVPYMDSTYYSMGACYKNLNESRKALDMYQKIIGTYPKSPYAIYSQTRINEITGRP